jgi:hypothetical protein
MRIAANVTTLRRAVMNPLITPSERDALLDPLRRPCHA